ncbi:AAA family ATPase [Oxalobacteraceae bacterium R-40]|uniref:AAA family ATPase n=1 Tax=Keguizhuia sedimenti TaxID=3064264 RepID=A0ABU1BIW1_9BURK|nr:AAA family ATPase [Oxalobacteraceae bacterium R-40]
MKALVISKNDHLQKEIATLVARQTSPISILPLNAELAEAFRLVTAHPPDLAIIDASNMERSQLSLVEALHSQYPHTAFMLLTPDQSPDLLLRAMRAGVREVLPLPLESQGFLEALDRAGKKIKPSIKNGKVMSFISCKGGSGATFLATNFGFALSTLAQKKVLLIDLNRQFGDAALYVSDKKPAMTLHDVCAQIHRIDPEFLESSLISVTPNFGLLAASDDPAHSAHIKPEHIATILQLARHYYDFIILDIDRQIDAVAIQALDDSDVIYPVLQLTMPYIRDTTRLLNIFQSLSYPREKIQLIVNRYEKRGELRLSDVRNAVGDSMLHTIPNNYKPVSDSINQGVPLLQLARNSAVARSLTALADQYANRQLVQSGGLISRLLNSRVQTMLSNG